MFENLRTGRQARNFTTNVPKILDLTLGAPENVTNTTSENRNSAIRKCPNILDEWNGYPERFSFSQALEISRHYLLLRTVILQKKVAGCPCHLFPVVFENS